MFDTIFHFGTFGVVETVKSANKITGNATDTFKTDPFANELLAPRIVIHDNFSFF